ncbi:hypothetical protein VEGS09_24950 [Escherichia coli]|nr:hypothetical protein DWX09_26960 [Escherichia coli]BBP30794.1 hypothetical protein VEGS09_24950 [Escherichia coli]BEC10313.1 hypothetical protein VEE66_24830 [Escherichia coli]
MENFIALSSISNLKIKAASIEDNKVIGKVISKDFPYETPASPSLITIKEDIEAINGKCTR